MTAPHSLTVPLPPDAAFRLFTEGLPAWWPAARHSHAARKGARPARIEVTPGQGGAITEVAADGTRARWATITGWEPGRRLALSWALDDGTGSTTEVVVTFTPVRSGTRVDLDPGAPEVWQSALQACLRRAGALLPA